MKKYIHLPSGRVSQIKRPLVVHETSFQKSEHIVEHTCDALPSGWGGEVLTSHNCNVLFSPVTHSNDTEGFILFGTKLGRVTDVRKKPKKVQKLRLK